MRDDLRLPRPQLYVRKVYFVKDVVFYLVAVSLVFSFLLIGRVRGQRQAVALPCLHLRWATRVPQTSCIPQPRRTPTLLAPATPPVLTPFPPR
jgi:hypothetical protein